MVFNEGEGAGGVDTLLDSTLDSVDVAEAAVLKAAERSGFGEDDLSKLGIAVREAMVNAVAHGNRYSAHKKVHLIVAAGPDRLKIRIEDQGDGFDLGSVPDPLAQENLLRQSGRGLLLIRAFVDEFRIERAQPNGTALEIVKYLSQPRGQRGELIL
jgi:serine/threonine-protein kinase RsbW